MCADGRTWHSSAFVNGLPKMVEFTISFDKPKDKKRVGKRKPKRRNRKR